MKKILFTVLAAILSIAAGNSAKAQSTRPLVAVNGLEIGHKYNHQQIVAAMGREPVEMKLSHAITPNYKTYIYGTNAQGAASYLAFKENGEFHCFELHDDNFSVNGRYNVGENISEILTTLYGTPVYGVPPLYAGNMSKNYIRWSFASYEVYPIVYFKVDYTPSNSAIRNITAMIMDL